MNKKDEAFEKWWNDNQDILSNSPAIYFCSAKSWQAAQQQSAGEIEILKESTTIIAEKYLALKAENERLREALEFYANLDWKENTEVWQLPAKEALSATTSNEALSK